MKYFTWIVVAALLSSCSLLRRHADEPENTPSVTAEAEKDPEKLSSATVDGELARLNSKIEALETKLDVLSNNLERLQMKKQQPEIHAEEKVVPAQKATVHEKQVTEKTPPNNAAAENDFKSNMTLFQSGKNAEAGAGFSSFANKYQNHVLASHALYWSGEAYARNQQWPSAIESWNKIQKNYPTSAYIPEALAGLSRAYSAQGDETQSQQYKNLIQKSFAHSPIAMSLATHQTEATPETEEAPSIASEPTETPQENE